MKLLFDQNLSTRLVKSVSAMFPDSSHVRWLRLDKASDNEIWKFAKKEGYCIVSYDADFAERSHLYGSPPKVIWLRCGNATPGHIEEILKKEAETIKELLGDPQLHYIELF